jgi:hypothetical protein
MGRGETFATENIMLIAIALGVSASQGPDLARLPLKSCFHCIPHVSESIL